jgi:hypothetical protein
MNTFTTPTGLEVAHATILAALRHYEATAFNYAGDLDGDAGIYDIATNGGRIQEATREEIELLCVELNCGALVLKTST